MGCRHDFAGSELYTRFDRMYSYCDCSSLDSSYLSSKGDISERINSALNSVKLFFASRSLKTSVSSRSSNVSSGYGSLDNSWELEESYVKVSKLSDFEESGEIGHYGTYKEYKEMALQQRLASEIKNIVECNSQQCIKISDYLTLRMATDVVTLSKCEPCGLKGCKLIVIVQNGDEVILERSTYPEKGLMCTFEISLVLHLQRRQSFRIFEKNENYGIMEQYELRKETLYTNKKHRKVLPRFKKWQTI